MLTLYGGFMTFTRSVTPKIQIHKVAFLRMRHHPDASRAYANLSRGCSARGTGRVVSGCGSIVQSRAARRPYSERLAAWLQRRCGKYPRLAPMPAEPFPSAVHGAMRTPYTPQALRASSMVTVFPFCQA